MRVRPWLCGVVVVVVLLLIGVDRLGWASSEELLGVGQRIAARPLALTAGGIFFPDVWYDACDELGVMVYHDMQYAQEGHSPANDTTQVSRRGARGAV